MPRLVDNIVEEYKKGTRIIVDRLISDEHYFNELITLLQHPLYASALVDTKYWEMIDAMKDLHVTIVGTGYFEHCGTSKHFEAYCKNRVIASIFRTSSHTTLQVLIRSLLFYPFQIDGEVGDIADVFVRILRGCTDLESATDNRVIYANFGERLHYLLHVWLAADFQHCLRPH